MAPDGTIVFARFAPDGALEVRERPPGGPIGASITIPPVAVNPQPFPNLQVLVGADGTAAVLTDIGGLRYASMRAPGGTWTDLDVAGVSGSGSGQAAIAPDGVLWLVGRAPAGTDALAVFRTAPGGTVQVTPLPDPPSGAHHFARALTVPRAGGARVLYLEESVTAQGEDCAITTAVVEVDVSDGGDAGPPTVVDRFTATGRGPVNACVADSGEFARDPLLATDAAGADTAVYSVLSFTSFTVTVRARHRDSGGAWPDRARPAEVVGGADVIAEKLIGGPGAPLVVVRGVAERSVSTRGPDGVWSAPALLVGIEGALSYDAARTGAGTTVFAWIEGAASARVVGRVVGADGTPADRHPLAAARPGATMLAVGGDAEGNATALYSQSLGGVFTLRMNGYDAAGPRLTSVSIPERAAAGAAVPFSLAGLDVWSGPLRTADWDFGDGARSRGLAVSHAYASGGSRTVQVRAEDASGNATTAAQPLTIADAPSTPAAPAAPFTAPTPPRDARAPVVRGLSINPRRPRAGRSPMLVLTTDEAGSLRVSLARTAPGVRSGNRCVARSRGRGHKRCTRTLARRSVSRALAAGARHVTLPRLAAGTWTVTAIVTDAAGNRSNPGRQTFRVA